MADRHRLTILHDDRSFRDRRERLLDDMRRQVDEDLRRFGFGRHNWSTDLGGSSISRVRGSDWKDNDPIGRLVSDDFFRLRPSSPVASALSSARRDEFGSHDSLDDACTVRGLLSDAGARSTPTGSSASSSPVSSTASGRSVAASAGGGPRLFSMSFDVKEYDPEDISITVEERTMIVRATNRAERDGAVSMKEFSRKVNIPPDVDPEKLTSTLSSDGILTVEAPVPPLYASSTSAFSPYQPVQQQQQQQQQQMLQNTSQNGSLSSSTSSAAAGTSPLSPAAAATPLDTPVFQWDEAAGRRRLNLLLEVGQPYTADDVVVKLDGRKLIVEATHVDKFQGRSSKTSMQRDFDLAEDIDVSSIRALLQTNGQLAVTAYAV